MLHGTYVIDIICNYLYFVFVSEYYYLDIYYINAFCFAESDTQNLSG